MPESFEEIKFMPVPVSYPGVYIEEVSSGVHTITGVATSIAAFFGRASKGPLNQAVRILSPSDYTRAFGGPHPESDLAQSVRMFFDNGGTDCYVVRLAKGAVAAVINLKSLDTKNVLVATAKSPGALGNGLKLEVSFGTARPDETFNLTVIQEDGGAEVDRETYMGLSMAPASTQFAPDVVTQGSSLIKLELHADSKVGGATDITNLANSFAGFSQSRDFLTTPIAAFRTEFELLLTNTPNFVVSVDGNQTIEISLATVLGAVAPAIPPGSTWSLAAMATRIQQVMNDQLNAAVTGLSVGVSFPQTANCSALRVTAASGAQRWVRITRPSDPTKDFASAAMLGIDQGGIEAARYSNFRPAPTGAALDDIAAILPLGNLQRDDITSIAIDGEPAITFSFASLTPAPTDPWFLDSRGKRDGIREKLQAITQAINNTTASSWRAELWGYRLALLAKSGLANKTPASVVSAGNTTLGGANFSRNVRRYSLGLTGTSSFQVAPVAADNGTDGSPFTLTEFQGVQNDQTGLYALDGVDLFNLMVIPGDSGISSSVQETFWGPASDYCQQRRAFLIIDPPDTWVKNGRPEVKNNTALITALRNTVAKQNSAVFFPRLIYNSGGLQKTIAPSGVIAGLMSRIDATRGVWKAPAGIEADLRGVVDLEVNLTDAENGVLNKQAVNCERIFPSGIVSWGARTMDGFDDQGSEWKYIPIRRLALYLEESLYRGTKWVVFEPNDEPLWAKIRLNLNAFMMGLFRQGAFQGSTPDKAFFVKCDGETTTQNDRNLGIVNIDVGFAPLKPAEFVIIRIQQIAGDLN
jgi:phage tail sheath protein FI